MRYDVAKKDDWKDDGRRCRHCKGPRYLQCYDIGDSDGNTSLEDFHDVCVGSWLILNPGYAAAFHAGEV